MISIIGAGPVGSYLAYLLAKNNQEVHIFEEHKDIGKPISCTGLLTEDIYKLISLPKNIIANTTNKAIIRSKNNSTIIPTKEIIVFRDKFDKYLLNLAIKAGAKLHKNHKYESFKNNTIHFKKQTPFKTKILIGADGPNSQVARTNNLTKNRKFYIGIQARVKINTPGNTYQAFFGKDFPNFFGWIVPENNNTARVGIAAKHNPNLIFNNFLKQLNIKSIIEKQGGLIPIYNKKQIFQKNNIYLIGDAATTVKATTGGGLIPSLKSAKILTNCIIKKLNFNKEIRPIKTSLNTHLIIRNILNNFNDKDYNLLIKYTNQKKIKSILNNNSRESPLLLLIKLAIAEPRFLRFILKAKL